jgi:hypothetical protein
MKLKVFETRMLLKWQQTEVIDVKNKGEKIIIDSPHAVSNESDLAKKIKEATNQDIPTEEEYPKWEVIRVGEDVKNYKVGDLVLCHVNSGTNLPTKENGKSELYRLITEKEVYGTWDETL